MSEPWGAGPGCLARLARWLLPWVVIGAIFAGIEAAIQEGPWGIALLSGIVIAVVAFIIFLVKRDRGWARRMQRADRKAADKKAKKSQ